MLVLQVFIMRNGAFEGTEMVTGDRVEIGRDPTCSLQLDDESVSRRHAVIFEHDGKLALQDLGSANGTRVNGEPIGSGRFLGPRDDIAIGAFMLKVKLMSGKGQQPAPAPIQNGGDGATRVYPQPTLESLGLKPSAANAPQAPQPHDHRSTSAPRPVLPPTPNPASIAVGHAPNNERTIVAIDAAHTVDSTTAPANPPPPPPISEPSSPALGQRTPMAAQGSRPQARPPSPLMPDITAPDAPMPARPASPLAPSGSPSVSPSASLARAQHTAPDLGDLGGLGGISDDLEIPRSPINTDGEPLAPLSFQPRFLAEELVEEDDEPVWSLVQRLVRPSTNEKSKEPLVEVVHYRGEVVVDHQVLKPGETYKLGENMTRAERRDRGIPRAIPLVRLKEGGVAEIFQREEVAGRLLRGNQQIDLAPGKGAVPITDGELASLKVGNERVFVRFAGAPKLLWTKDDAAEDRFNRKLNGIAAGSSVGLFMLFAVVSWIYQYRNADSEVIKIEDEGFAEVEIKKPEMPEPPKEEPKPVEPTEVKDAPPTPKDQKTPPTPEKQPANQPDKPVPQKPTMAELLNKIPTLDTKPSALNDAVSNIKGIRVPGGASGFKVSELVGKTPSAGVQIGNGAGGVSTSGINALMRKDGSAGALGGKADHAIGGKVTAMKSQLRASGQGELSKEEIQKVINQHIGEIQYCYEKQLNKQPGLSGRVVLEWNVSLQGHVTVVKVQQSSLNSADATNCMMGKLKNWHFPSPKGGPVTIVFPFVFNTV